MNDAEKISQRLGPVEANPPPRPGRQFERRTITDRSEWAQWRGGVVGASVAACLFGDELHPYMSAFELWALKSHKVGAIRIENSAMRRGLDLEPLVIKKVRELRPDWQVEPCSTHYFDPEARIGATPDAMVLASDRDGIGNLQLKTADAYAWRHHWITHEGEIEIPLWICIQATVESFMTGWEWSNVAVLEMGAWEVHIFEVPIVWEIIDRLYELVADFWRRVREGDWYPPRWASDGDLIARMFADAQPVTIDLSADNEILGMIDERAGYLLDESLGNAAEKARKALEKKIIFKIGEADRVLLPDGRVMWAPTRRRGAYEVEATSWRQLTFKEPKK